MKSHTFLDCTCRFARNAAVGFVWVVEEFAKRSGKSVSRGLRKAPNAVACCVTTAVALLLLTPQAWAANAASALVTVGSGSVSTSGVVTTITQTSQRLVIDWTKLSTAGNEALVFAQPNAQAIALNRIIGGSSSVFLGSVTANGQVFLLNPNGILFGAGAQVNVGGLVASALSLSNSDFMAGNHLFIKAAGSGSTGSVINQGNITVANGGYIALLGNEVRNEGVMSATLGTALLAAGNKVTLKLNNGSLLGYSIDEGALNALAENRNLIRADGGLIVLSAKAFDALSSATVNNTGIIEAKTMSTQGGRIKLISDLQVGQLNLTGTLNASAPNGGSGGLIETSAAHVNVMDTAKVTTLASKGQAGTWLIDPLDYTIAEVDPGNGGSYMSNTTLSANLSTGNIALATLASSSSAGNGDIFVNGAVSWNAGTRLTLSAQRNITINQSITAQHAMGSLALEYGQGAAAAGNASVYNVNAPINLQAGGTFSTRQGSDGPTTAFTVITALGAAGSSTTTDLQGINGGLAGLYVLGSNVDAAVTANWNGGAGFVPVGSPAAPFTGIFDGLGHSVSNLTINRLVADSASLFGTTGLGSVVRNLTMPGGGSSGNLMPASTSVTALAGPALVAAYGATLGNLADILAAEHMRDISDGLTNAGSGMSEREATQAGAPVGADAGALQSYKSNCGVALPAGLHSVTCN